jgi:hypothetical protein
MFEHTKESEEVAHLEVVKSFVVSFAYCGLIPPSTVSSCVTASDWKCFERSLYCAAKPSRMVRGNEEGGCRSLQPI